MTSEKPLRRSSTCKGPRISTTTPKRIQHIHGGDAQKPFDCFHCPYKYDEKSFVMHLKAIREQGTTTLRCTQCPFETEKVLLLKNHVTQPHGVNQVSRKRKSWTGEAQATEYPQPSPAAKRSKKPKTNENQVPPIPSDLFQCDKCNYTSKRKGDIVRHNFKVKANNFVHKCGYCEEFISCTLERVTQHRHKMHQGMAPNTVKVLLNTSPKTAPTTTTTPAAVATATDDSDKPVSDSCFISSMVAKGRFCSYCNRYFKLFKTREHLIGHINQVHRRSIVESCPVPGCSFKSKFRSNLLRHMKMSHAEPLTPRIKTSGAGAEAPDKSDASGKQPSDGSVSHRSWSKLNTSKLNTSMVTRFCPYCKCFKLFRTRENFISHIINVHKKSQI